MKAPVAHAGDFKPAPSGAHQAILIGLLDLGTQESTYEGKTTHRRKVRLVFELHSEEAVTDDGKPMVVGREFTLSSHEKSTLRNFIEGWRGKDFSDEEAEQFDYQTMLGKPCLLNITHSTSPAGKVYANVVSAMRVPKGFAVAEQVNPSTYLYLGTETSNYAEYDPEVFNGLAQWLKEKIWKSPEYQAAVQRKVAVTSEDEDQEIPY